MDSARWPSISGSASPHLPTTGTLAGPPFQTSAPVLNSAATPNGPAKPIFKMKRTGGPTLPSRVINSAHSKPSTPSSTNLPVYKSLYTERVESEPAKVTSDITPPPAETFSLRPKPAPELAQLSNTGDTSNGKKFATDGERRNAISEALRRRWASGSMDYVHKKRIETQKLKKETLGQPGVTKPAGKPSAGLAAGYPKAAVSNFPNLQGLSQASTHNTEPSSASQQRPPSSSANDKSCNFAAESAEWHRQFSELSAQAASSTHDPISGLSSEDKKKAELVSAEWHREYDGYLAAASKDPPEVTVEGEGTEESEPSSYYSLAETSEWGEAAEVDEDEDAIIGEDTPTAIELATPDRSYKTWRERGVLVSTNGALLPEGYKHTGYSSTPWGCPVRSCPKMFKQLSGLGAHFSITHTGELLHDNEDGTLIKIGTYAQGRRHHTNGHKKLKPTPALVVSKGPMSAAYAAAHSIANEAESGDSVMEDAEDKPIDRNEQDGSSGAQDDTDMLEDDLDAMDVARSDEDDRAIVAPELVPPAITMAEPNRPYDKWIDPQTGEVLPLLGVLLPTGYKLDKTVPGRKWICPVRSCKRLFIKAQDLSFHFLRTHYGALLNDNCDGTFSVTGFYKDNRVGITKSGKVLIPGPPIVASKQASEEQEPPVSSWVHRPEGHGHLNLDRRRTSRKYDADEEDEEQQDDEQVASRSETTSLTRKLRPRRQLSRPSAGTSEPSPALLQSAPKSSLLSDGMFQSAESLEMETWEMAPGRLRESTGDNPENIAYSKAYLSANHEASVCDDVTVRVSTIYSGTTLKLNADATKMRICSVGTGKVSVQLGGEPEFVIGPHGMFKVKPGVACVVRNTMYLDATLHMTLLSGFT